MKTLPLLLLLACASALADDAAMLRCRAVPDIPTRVACYDAIPVAAPRAAAPSASVAASAASAATGASAAIAATTATTASPATAATAATPSNVAAPVGVAASVAAGAVPAPAAPAWTALPAKPVAKAEEPKQADTVETRIEGAFKGWAPGQMIHLANGQVWRVVDNSSEDTDLQNPKALLRKGLLGAVFLDIEGAYRAPRVKRVQ